MKVSARYLLIIQLVLPIILGSGKNDEEIQSTPKIDIGFVNNLISTFLKAAFRPTELKLDTTLNSILQDPENINFEDKILTDVFVELFKTLNSEPSSHDFKKLSIKINEFNIISVIKDRMMKTFKGIKMDKKYIPSESTFTDFINENFNETTLNKGKTCNRLVKLENIKSLKEKFNHFINEINKVKGKDIHRKIANLCNEYVTFASFLLNYSKLTILHVFRTDITTGKLHMDIDDLMKIEPEFDETFNFNNIIGVGFNLLCHFEHYYNIIIKNIGYRGYYENIIKRELIDYKFKLINDYFSSIYSKSEEKWPPIKFLENILQLKALPEIITILKSKKDCHRNTETYELLSSNNKIIQGPTTEAHKITLIDFLTILKKYQNHENIDENNDIIKKLFLFLFDLGVELKLVI